MQSIANEVDPLILCLLEPTGLLCKRLSFGLQLLIEGMDDLQVLSSLLVLDLLALTEPSDHPLIGHAPVLKGLHTHQRLKPSMTVKIKRNFFEV